MIIRIIFISALLSALVSLLAPASADEEVLPPSIAAIIEKAAVRQGGAGFVDAVLLVMDAQPLIAAGIYAYAVSIAPAREEELAAAASGVFPELAAAEPVVPPPPPAGLFDLAAWDGNLELGGSVSTGNTDEEAIAFGVGLTNDINDVWDHAVNVRFDYARRTGVTTKQRFLADYQINYHPWSRTYVFGYLQYDDDRFSGFDYRLLESAGVGHTLFDNDKQKWKIEGGPGVRQNKIPGQSLEVEFVAVLSSNYRYFFNESVNAGDTVKVFAGADRTTIENTADMVAKLNAALSAKLSFGVKYDSNVPAGSVKMDTITKISLLYDF